MKDEKCSSASVCAKLECRYELLNATNERYPFMQEVTVDDPDHGYVEESFFANAKSIYVLKSPRVAERPLSYSIFRGAEFLLEQSWLGVKYECRATWLSKRS
jgi:hypothetical protein